MCTLCFVLLRLARRFNLFWFFVLLLLLFCFCWLLFLLLPDGWLTAGWLLMTSSLRGTATLFEYDRVSHHSDSWFVLCATFLFNFIVGSKMSLSLQMNTRIRRQTNVCEMMREKSAQQQWARVIKAKLLRKTHPIWLIPMNASHTSIHGAHHNMLIAVHVFTFNWKTSSKFYRFYRWHQLLQKSNDSFFVSVRTI